MIRNSRFVAAVALVVALGVSALAFADGASENTISVLGKITPAKLDKKKYVPVTMYNGVTTNTTHSVPGQQNAEKVTVEYPTNIQFNFADAVACTAPLNGTTTDQAKQACPPKSIIGSGNAHANLGGGPDQVSDTVVTVIVTKINSKNSGIVDLHAYTPELGASNTQNVVANIVPKSVDKGFGPSLIVNDAPDLAGDAFMLTKFDATIPKSSKGVYGRCKSKTNNWRNITVYDDGSKESADLTTKCKQKK